VATFIGEHFIDLVIGGFSVFMVALAYETIAERLHSRG